MERWGVVPEAIANDEMEFQSFADVVCRFPNREWEVWLLDNGDLCNGFRVSRVAATANDTLVIWLKRTEGEDACDCKNCQAVLAVQRKRAG